MARVGAFFSRQGTKIAEFWKQLGADYATVAKDTVSEAKARPMKTVVVLAGLGALGYAYKTNPSYEDTMNDLRGKRQQMVLVPNAVHNPITDKEIAQRSELLCQNRLHYYNLWFFSLLVKSTHDDKVRIFSSQETALKDWPWTEFWNNILDVGLLGQWCHLTQKFNNFDVNKDELELLPA